MKKLKQAGVVAGAALGGVVGGTVSFVGKVIRQPEIDQLGENIMDSAILTGEIAGHAMSGAADVVTGAVKRDKRIVKAGGRDLKKAGTAIGKNVIANASVVLMEAGNVAVGVKTGDTARVVKGLKTMGKMAAIEFLTVGAIKMDEPLYEGMGVSNKEKKPAEKKPTVVRVVRSGPMTARIHPTQEEIDAHRRKAVAAKEVKKQGLFRRLFG